MAQSSDPTKPDYDPNAQPLVDPNMGLDPAASRAALIGDMAGGTPAPGATSDWQSVLKNAGGTPAPEPGTAAPFVPGEPALNLTGGNLNNDVIAHQVPDTQTPFMGFNSLDAAKGRGGLKDRVQMALNGVDPSNWAQIKQAMAPLGSEVTLDDVNQNIDLTGDRGGYVGVRPQDRGKAGSPNAFQWMAYNNSVQPGGGFKPGDINTDDPSTGDALTGKVGPGGGGPGRRIDPGGPGVDKYGPGGPVIGGGRPYNPFLPTGAAPSVDPASANLYPSIAGADLGQGGAQLQALLNRLSMIAGLNDSGQNQGRG